ncbi:conserved Plasmodium protein, unknown function [Plasmodium ovale wallikeri]|uniref:Uncharacterized protein n=1 Tax=Plasmodium ovale wallikeri TaxID=864142 RepID=A0A1A8ZBB4_PLAOA|nr:conserved Plasmodium protein, unknown function [Plasmodium ovale wallikeri]SBT41490.1 conserved Plasmodium protein, unknown function [Plasmodium ovale wallikeri]
MSIKNKMQVNDLNKTVFRENYKIRRNTREVEHMETIENLSDDIMSNNDSFDSNPCSKIPNKKIKEKVMEKTKKENFKNNKNKHVTDDIKETQTYYSNIPQIYETWDSSPRDNFHMENNNSDQVEMNVLSNVIAILYIIIAVVIILHLHLNEDHIIIKTISLLKLKFVYLIKSIPIFKNLMKTNNKINGFLDVMIDKSNITRPYIESLKQLNTEFSILFIILILMFFTATSILHIIYGIINMKQEKDYLEKDNVVFVTNKMTVEEYEDKSFTYSELAKLHDDKDYICLKNKRAGEGIESWNWQIRKLNNANNDKDICSDIEFSDWDCK